MSNDNEFDFQTTGLLPVDIYRRVAPNAGFAARTVRLVWRDDRWHCSPIVQSAGDDEGTIVVERGKNTVIIHS